MYGCYCNCNMNWLMGIGLLFNALGNVLSPKRAAYPVYTAASYPNYSYTAVDTSAFTSPSEPETDFNLVGDLLSGGSAASAYPAFTSGASLWNIANPVPQVSSSNLVGDLLTTPFTPSPVGYMPSFLPNSESCMQAGIFQGNSLLASEFANNASLGQLLLNNTSGNFSANLQEQISAPVGDDASVQRTAAKVTPSNDIINRVKQIAQKINCDYKDLLGLIFCESSFKTVPANWNGKSAVGLTQFTNICIEDINKTYGKNYTKAQIAKMTALQQLDLVELSLLRAKQVAGFQSSHKLTAGELYAINLLPRNARKDVVAQQGDGNYEGNKGLDINKDGKITKSELTAAINNGKLSVVC